MPSITFTSKGQQAVQLFNISMLLKGDPAQFTQRAKLREKILKTWPELDSENPEDRPEEKDMTPGEKEAARQKRLTQERSFDISATQQTALAEGFLKYIQDPEITDSDKELVLSLAKKVKCRYKFLEPRLAKVEIREFAESDEEIEVDEDEAPAAPPPAPVETAPAEAPHG
jgi:hypothetical protein